MPALIQSIIPPSAMELIRDRIKEILDTEFAGQAALCAAHVPPIPFDVPTIFTERYVTVDQQEGSVIVVRLNDGVYSNKDQESVNGDYEFYIDCYAYSEEIGTSDAYYLSSKKMEKLMALVRSILQDQSYRTLGFTPPAKGGFLNIRAVNIARMKVGTRVDMPDALAETCGRVTLAVEVGEVVESKLTALFLESLSQIGVGGPIVDGIGYQVNEIIEP